MKQDIATIAGEYITLEGDGAYEKAGQLIAEKGIVTPTLQNDLDKIAGARYSDRYLFQTRYRCARNKQLKPWRDLRFLI